MAFFPPHHDREGLVEAGVPLLVGTQSLRPAEAFDLVLISNAYTLELVNLPYLFLNSGIPLWAEERGEEWPPFVLGGSNALASQAVIAPGGGALVDALFFGEGEERVEALSRSLYEDRLLDKGERLERAASRARGLWPAGDLTRFVDKAICAAPRADDLLVDYPLLNGSQASTARLQINFGCPAFCSFCFEGYDRKPYRELPLEAVMETARRLKREQGPDELDLYSFNFNVHSDVLSMLPELNRLFHRVSLKSQRVDLLYTTPGLLAAEVAADKRSFTLGIEGISEEQRAFLHKSLTTEAVLAVLATLFKEPIREVKLFYMLTGHETEADLAEFRGFVRDVKALRRRGGRRVRVVFSFGLLVRMPFTPLRYDRLILEEGEWKGLVGPVKATCETNGFEFRLATPWEEYASSQVLALGGYWLHEPVIELARKGHCYDTTLTEGYWESLREWMETHGHWEEAFLGEKPPTYAFPLDFVRSAMGAEYLYRKFRQAQAAVDEGYCLDLGKCLGCAACAVEVQRQEILHHTMRQPDPAYWAEFPRLMKRKWRLSPLYARLRLPPVVGGVSPEWRNAWALRSLLRACPPLVDELLVARESLFTVGDNVDLLGDLPYGEGVFALEGWDEEGIREALAGFEGEGFTFLGWAEGFEPGVFRQLALDLTLPVARFPDAGQRLRRFLQDNYVPTNVRREDSGYRFVVPDKALKKKALLGGSYEEVGGQFHAHLTVGPKFDLLGYLRSFGERGAYRLAQVAVRDVVW
jgi:radical SAM superfamily enzyme YgiQ (UPF0313 family)